MLIMYGEVTIFRHYPKHVTGETDKNHKIHQDHQCPSQDSNGIPVKRVTAWANLHESLPIVTKEEMLMCMVFLGA
jgi:hypothetical protein